jgi:hypothetical protein
MNKTVVKTFTCVECNKTTNQGSLCSVCKKPICKHCTGKNHKRAEINKFYVYYKNYCDACIWFDLG